MSSVTLCLIIIKSPHYRLMDILCFRYGFRAFAQLINIVNIDWKLTNLNHLCQCHLSSEPKKKCFVNSSRTYIVEVNNKLRVTVTVYLYGHRTTYRTASCTLLGELGDWSHKQCSTTLATS